MNPTQMYAYTRWVFDLKSWKPTLTQLIRAVAAIEPAERTRLMKFHFLEDFLTSLIGQLLMRKYVSECTGLNFYNVRFGRDVRGKPYWAGIDNDAVETNTQLEMNQKKLSFNVSHQGHYVVLAGIKNNANVLPSNAFGVGVDVMKIEYTGGRPLPEFFRLMRSKFSDNEWQYILRSPHDQSEQLKAFMRHWCLKEAYVKELGVGITIDLQKIDFTVDRRAELTNRQPLTNTRLHVDNVLMDNYCFEEHLLQSDYCVAIAFKNCKPSSGKFEYLMIDDLLDNIINDENITFDSINDAEIIVCCNNALKKQRRTLVLN